MLDAFLCCISFFHSFIHSFTFFFFFPLPASVVGHVIHRGWLYCDKSRQTNAALKCGGIVYWSFRPVAACKDVSDIGSKASVHLQLLVGFSFAIRSMISDMKEMFSGLGNDMIRSSNSKIDNSATECMFWRCLCNGPRRLSSWLVSNGILALVLPDLPGWTSRCVCAHCPRHLKQHY